jgi:ribosomal protein L10
MDDIKNVMIARAIEQYNLTDKQADYLRAEMEDITVNEDDSILIRNSGEFNSNMDIIKQAVIVEGDRHICYL